jgi:hypothetical protein
MNHRLVFFGLLCCLLVFTGLNVAAQETAPLPPPDESAWPLPPPGGESSGKSGGGLFGVFQAPQRRQPGQGSAPAARPATPPAAQPATPSATQPDKGASVAQPDKGASAPAARTETAAPAPAGIPSKGFYWGLMAGFSKYGYQGEGQGTKEWEGKFGFAGGLILARDFGIWALQMELLVSGDNLKYRKDVYQTTYDPFTNFRETSYHEERIKMEGTHLQIPILVKLDLHLGRFLLQPLAGIYWNIGLDALEYENKWSDVKYKIEHENPLMGFMLGGTVGFRIGKGHIIADYRYAKDLGDVSFEVNEANNSWFYFNRSAFKAIFGYQRYF